MTVIKYTANPDSWIVLTDREFEQSIEQWISDIIVYIPRIKKLVPPCKYQPSGSIPGFENHELFFRPDQNQILSWHKRTGDLEVIRSIANEEGYYSFTRLSAGNYSKERVKKFLENKHLVPIDDVIDIVYPDLIKIPGQRTNE